MATIYIVQGCSGSYSDYHEWVAASYADRDKAALHCAAATKCAESISALCYDSKDDEFSHYDLPSGINPWDVEMSMDYDGVSYSVYGITVRDELPDAEVIVTEEALRGIMRKEQVIKRAISLEAQRIANAERILQLEGSTAVQKEDKR